MKKTQRGRKLAWRKKRKTSQEKNYREGSSYTPLGDGAYGKDLGPS